MRCSAFRSAVYRGAVVICILFLVRTAEAGELSPIQRAISKQLSDPNSAHFTQLYRSKVAPQVYCGKVTSKNKTGHDTGERLFLYDTQFDSLTILENPQVFQYDLDTSEKLQKMDRTEAAINSYIALCVLNR
jgi:hypothetical protein